MRLSLMMSTTYTPSASSPPSSPNSMPSSSSSSSSSASSVAFSDFFCLDFRTGALPVNLGGGPRPAL